MTGHWCLRAYIRSSANLVGAQMLCAVCAAISIFAIIGCIFDATAISSCLGTPRNGTIRPPLPPGYPSVNHPWECTVWILRGYPETTSTRKFREIHRGMPGRTPNHTCKDARIGEGNSRMRLCVSVRVLSKASCGWVHVVKRATNAHLLPPSSPSSLASFSQSHRITQSHLINHFTRHT